MQTRSKELRGLLKALRLPAMADTFASLALKAAREHLTFEEYLYELARLEQEGRDQRRVERLLQQSGLPTEKTFEMLKLERFPLVARQQIDRLRKGGFLKESVNVVAVGKPGTGKSHIAAAMGLELVRDGHSVFYTPAYALVQRLLRAKHELRLPQELGKLDRFECLILDDIGYVQQEQEEMEVLFTLLSDRYERRSTVITTNLAFSQWDRIFKNPMTTMAAIDRVVHHSVVLDLMGMDSYRAEEAERNAATTQETPTHDGDALDTEQTQGDDTE